MLKVSNLNKSFGDLRVIKNVSFEISKGEVVAILGPSGTGKSTLLRCLNYLEKPDSGKLEIGNFNVDFSNINKKDIYNLRKHSCMVFQQYNLFKNKTVIENLLEPLIYVKKIPRMEALKISENLLEKVSMLDKKNEYPSRLSGGQQQRVGIARALAVNPDIILFDEPTSSLDPELVEEVLNVIKSLSELNITMMIVTHEIDFARSVANKIIFMYDGEILESGRTEKILVNPKNERIRQFLKLDRK